MGITFRLADDELSIAQGDQQFDVDADGLVEVPDPLFAGLATGHAYSRLSAKQIADARTVPEAPAVADVPPQPEAVAAVSTAGKGAKPATAGESGATGNTGTGSDNASKDADPSKGKGSAGDA